MMEKLKKNKLYIKYGIIIIFIAIVVVLTVKTIAYGEDIISWTVYEFKRFLTIIAPVIYAALLAYILYEPVNFIENSIKKVSYKASKKHIKDKYNGVIRAISLILVLLAIILLGIVIYNYLVPPIITNIKEILNSLPEFQEDLKGWINQIVESLNSKNLSVESTGELTGEIVNKVSGYANNILNIVVGTLGNISSFALNFVVTLILTLYFLMDKERLIRQMKKARDVLLPEKTGRHLTVFMHDLDNIVGKFIIGELLDSIIVGIVSTVLLLLIKHPFAVLIGTIAGITNIIPYVGPIIGAALAFFFGIFTSVPLGIAGAILLLLYQQVDGNFVQPKIVGDKIGLSPVWILIAVLIGGSYFGPLGMILSMPIAGLIRIYFNRYAEKKSKDS
ncbi:AI-2E family transporter [Clostridium sp.]|uniref:AI-2E family transporter n=1 Tax=Clostridium sp. TaxID=1506 RepID=UPI003F2CB561